MSDFNHISGELQGFGTCLDIGDLFQKAGADLKDMYLSYIYEAASAQKSSQWWFTSLSYRSGYESTAFHQICLLKAAIDVTEAYMGNEPLVILADYPMRDVLRVNFEKMEGVVVAPLISPRKYDFSIIQSFGRTVVHRAYFVAREIYKIVYARLAVPRKDHARGNLIVLFCWATRFNILRENEYYKSYFGELLTQLDNWGYSTATVPMIQRDVSYQYAVGKLKHQSVLFPHSFLLIRDVLSVALSTMSKI